MPARRFKVFFFLTGVILIKVFFPLVFEHATEVEDGGLDESRFLKTFCYSSSTLGGQT
jgi:hypothetical protein